MYLLRLYHSLCPSLFLLCSLLPKATEHPEEGIILYGTHPTKVLSQLPLSDHRQEHQLHEVRKLMEEFKRSGFIEDTTEA